MPRKRKYTRRSQEGWYKKFDWSVNPQTFREIIAIVCFLVGLLVILSMFNLGGVFGENALKMIINLFGIAGFVIPLIFLGLGVMIWRERESQFRMLQILGVAFLFWFIPGLFLERGGSIGTNISASFMATFGNFGGYLLLLTLTIISFVAGTNISLQQIISWLFAKEEGDVSERPARISVFETVRNRFGRKEGVVPVMPGNQMPAPIIYSGDWTPPSIDLLEESSLKAVSGNIEKNIQVIQKSLRDFGMEVAMGEVHIGPTVTQYTLKPAEGVKLNQITARNNDLALALASHPIRIEAPIPGKAAVGIEIPNKVPAIVTLREVLDSPEMKSQKSCASLPLGRDVPGQPFIVDLFRMPHLLIAGATGSGKSVCINGIVTSLLYQNSPNNLKLLLIDPKRVEFTMYNGIPHLLAPVIVDVDKTINALRWAVAEMERRFHVLSESHKRNIIEYNSSKPAEPMPYITIVIDELADLMAQSANEVEAAIVRLAQLARAVGIHLIVATQRPSVDVITGLIKANITSRIAFAVASQIDSRTILDQAGAEKLLGNGDMLFVSSEIIKPKRAQGVMINEKEIANVTNFLKQKGEAVYDNSIAEFRPAGKYGPAGSGEPADDALYEDAQQVVVQAGKASASLLQRRLRIGYARAARLLDILEENGVIGQAEGAKPRDVLMSLEQLPRQQPADRHGQPTASYQPPTMPTGRQAAPPIMPINKQSDETSEGIPPIEKENNSEQNVQDEES